MKLFVYLAFSLLVLTQFAHAACKYDRVDLKGKLKAQDNCINTPMVEEEGFLLNRRYCFTNGNWMAIWESDDERKCYDKDYKVSLYSIDGALLSSVNHPVHLAGGAEESGLDHRWTAQRLSPTKMMIYNSDPIGRTHEKLYVYDQDGEESILEVPNAKSYIFQSEYSFSAPYKLADGQWAVSWGHIGKLSDSKYRHGAGVVGVLHDDLTVITQKITFKLPNKTSMLGGDDNVIYSQKYNSWFVPLENSYAIFGFHGNLLKAKSLNLGPVTNSGWRKEHTMRDVFLYNKRYAVGVVANYLVAVDLETNKHKKFKIYNHSTFFSMKSKPNLNIVKRIHDLLVIKNWSDETYYFNLKKL